MTDTEWVLLGPGKHDRAVCDTAEFWAKLFMLVWDEAGIISRDTFVRKNLCTAKHAVDEVTAGLKDCLEDVIRISDDYNA